MHWINDIPARSGGVHCPGGRAPLCTLPPTRLWRRHRAGPSHRARRPASTRAVACGRSHPALGAPHICSRAEDTRGRTTGAPTPSRPSPAAPTRLPIRARPPALDPMPSRHIIVTSFSAHHITIHPQGLLTRVREALSPDALFLGALWGGDSLHELRVALALAEQAGPGGGVSPRVSPMVHVRPQGVWLGWAEGARAKGPRGRVAGVACVGPATLRHVSLNPPHHHTL